MENQTEILALTQSKTRDLAGSGPSSKQLEEGLPIFYAQLVAALTFDEAAVGKVAVDKVGMALAAAAADEPAMARASGRHDEVELARSAGRHGAELLRLGYTLSHVVHAYGAMCQAINELAIAKSLTIAPQDFRRLNQCLDVAIAGAVTVYEAQWQTKESKRETEHLGSLAHELRNALNTVTLAFELIKEGTVTPRGSTGQMLERGLLRMDELIARSLTEVRLRVDPEVEVRSLPVLQLVDQIFLTAKVEARAKNQRLEISIDPALKISADQQLVHSALSNLIQNALKYTPWGGHIQVRAQRLGETVVVEVEDECGGLTPGAETSLFTPFEQHNENRKGLGLGLAISLRAILRNHGTLACQNFPGKGCLFRVVLPSA